MNKLLKIITSVLVSGIVAMLFFSLTAFAQETLKSTLKEVSEKSDKIVEIKENPKLSAEEKTAQEIQARKDVVYKTMELTALEDENLKNKLNSIENLSEEEIIARDYLLKLLGENLKTYEIIKNRLDNAPTNKEIKQLAKDFNNWRIFSYNQKSEKVIAFVAIFQQKKILAVAESRLQKMSGGIDKIKDTESLKKDLLEILQESAGILNEAKLNNDKALETMLSLIKNEINPQSLSFIKDFFSFGKKIVTPATVKKMISDSIQGVKETYSLFSKINELAEKE